MSEFEDENAKKIIGNLLIAPESDSLIMQQHEVDNMTQNIKDIEVLTQQIEDLDPLKEDLNQAFNEFHEHVEGEEDRGLLIDGST
ncbi:hypothetical protein P5673_030658 [Acropora cervicornis]|uniref:Uncharacterized protein n=1 Tax=Acropora cervicornis TaxID=6130 RepID=A0AAD9PTW7_ACRCE|nr:hypothetical protein P5673_030658 [Acropora cervicornis]